MSGNHLREPLDYLYEELPPEKMAEVRRHLAECPECRAQMRAIRETVKLYRQAEHPIAPVGLSARTIKNALNIARAKEAARAEKTANAEKPEKAAAATMPAALAKPAAKPAAKDVKKEEAKKEEAAKPKPAASPATRTESRPAPAPAAGAKPSRAELGDAEFARIKEEVLGEIHRGGWRSWLFHPAWTVAASVIFLCALLIHFSPRMHRREVPPAAVQAAVHMPDESGARLRERERLPASLPLIEDEPPAAAAAPILPEAAAMNEPIASFVSIPAPAPEARVPGETGEAAPFAEPARTAARAKIAVPREHHMPFLDETEDDGPATGEAAERRTESRARVFQTPVFPKPAARPETTAEQPEEPEEPEEPEAKDASERHEETGRREETADREENRSSPPASIVIMDGFSPDAAPEIVERPTPIDTGERVRSLTALIGMQIACGEYADARQALGILARYDARAADDLRVLLDSIPDRESEDKPKAVIGSPLPPDAPMPVDKPLPPVTPVEQPPPASRPEKPVPESVPAPEPVRDPVFEPVVPPASLRPHAVIEPTFQPAAPHPPASPEPPEPEAAPGIVIVEDRPEPMGELFIPEPEPEPEPDAREAPAIHLNASPLGIIDPPEDPPLSLVRVPTPPPEGFRPDEAPALPLSAPAPPALSPVPVPAQPPPLPPGWGPLLEEHEQSPPERHSMAPEAAEGASDWGGVSGPILVEAAATEPPPPIFADPIVVPIVVPVVVSLPASMEPAVSPEGFVRVRDGSDKPLWVAVGNGVPVAAPAAVPEPVPLPEPEPEPIAVPPPVRTLAAITPPVRTLVAVPVPPPVTHQTYAAPPVVVVPRTAVRPSPPPFRSRRASKSPEPYLRDY